MDVYNDLGRVTCRVTVRGRGRAGSYVPRLAQTSVPRGSGRHRLAQPSKAVGTRGTCRAASARERRHERDFRRRFKTT